MYVCVCVYTYITHVAAGRITQLGWRRIEHPCSRLVHIYCCRCTVLCWSLRAGLRTFHLAFDCDELKHKLLFGTALNCTGNDWSIWISPLSIRELSVKKHNFEIYSGHCQVPFLSPFIITFNTNISLALLEKSKAISIPYNAETLQFLLRRLVGS